MWCDAIQWWMRKKPRKQTVRKIEWLCQHRKKKEKKKTKILIDHSYSLSHQIFNLTKKCKHLIFIQSKNNNSIMDDYNWIYFVLEYLYRQYDFSFLIVYSMTAYLSKTIVCRLIRVICLETLGSSR